MKYNYYNLLIREILEDRVYSEEVLYMIKRIIYDFNGVFSKYIKMDAKHANFSVVEDSFSIKLTADNFEFMYELVDDILFLKKASLIYKDDNRIHSHTYVYSDKKGKLYYQNLIYDTDSKIEIDSKDLFNSLRKLVRNEEIFPDYVANYMLDANYDFSVLSELDYGKFWEGFDGQVTTIYEINIEPLGSLIDTLNYGIDDYNIHKNLSGRGKVLEKTINMPKDR